MRRDRCTGRHSDFHRPARNAGSDAPTAPARARVLTPFAEISESEKRDDATQFLTPAQCGYFPSSASGVSGVLCAACLILLFPVERYKPCASATDKTITADYGIEIASRSRAGLLAHGNAEN